MNLKRYFYFDLRALAVFRIALAVLFISEVIGRFDTIGVFYSDSGVLPRSETLVSANFFTQLISPHFWSGSELGVGLVFFTSAFFGVLFLLGIEAKLVGLVLLILTYSLRQRNTMVVNSGELLLQVLFFWSLFLPLDERYALRFKRKHLFNLKHETKFYLFYILQLLAVYFSAGFSKISSQLWQSGTAINEALGYHYLSTPLGLWLKELKQLGVFINYGTIVLEVLGPLLLFIFFKSARMRIFVVTAFWAFHMGIDLTLKVGLFSYISMVAWIPILPASFWDKLGLSETNKKLSALPRHPKAWIAEAAALLSLCIIFINDSKTLTFSRFNIHFFKNADTSFIPLKQGWQMFATPVKLEQGWLVIVAILNNGKRINYHRPNSAITWNKPDSWDATYPTKLWYNYLVNLANTKKESLRQSYLQFLCREWNLSHNELEQIQFVEFYQVLDTQKENESLFKAECQN